MNKLKFNNLVISNKKLIQQARVQTIQKCVQKIRKLKYLLEKEPEKRKYKDNLQRTVSLVDYLKKMKHFEIIRGVLLLEKKPTAVLTNIRASMEDVAKALLSMNKIMQSLLVLIKTELQLRENDASWRQQLQEISRRRAKFVRTEDKRRRRQEEKSQKLLSRKRQSWLEENMPDNKEVNEEKAISTSGIWKEEITNVESKSIKTEVSAKFTAKAQKTLKKNAVKTFRVVEKPNAAEAEVAAKIEVEVASTENVKQVVDPFFITQTGDNYVSTVISINAQNDDDGTLLEESSIVDFTRKRNRDNQFKNKRERNHTNQSSWQRQSSSNMNKDLQPSRVAVKHQSSNAKFQAKNTQFDDKQNKSTMLTKQSVGSQDLHPSWAAKQKLKPVITAFQGKKILFDQTDA